MHMAGHWSGHDVWHNWGVAHVAATLLWLVSAGLHVRRRRKWYSSVAVRGVSGNGWVTLALTLVFMAAAVTGFVLLVCIDGQDSSIGLWHYGLGIVLILLTLFHAVRRVRRKSGQTCRKH